MHFWPGNAQQVTAIDDGGISMSFCRESSKGKESHRVVLSVEVRHILPPPPLTIPGKTQKARPRK
jgi:hypothetical protein